jgi:hypothetical protein
MNVDAKLRARFAAKVDRNGPIPAHRPELGPCHVWTGGLSHDGYGKFSIGSRTDGTLRTVRAHRVSFYLVHRRWPEPFGLHHCDNRPCVNDAHLFEGTVAENSADMVAKDRQPAGERHGGRKLTQQAVRDMRGEYAAGGVTQAELAQRHGVSISAIGHILSGYSWARQKRVRP